METGMEEQDKVEMDSLVPETRDSGVTDGIIDDNERQILTLPSPQSTYGSTLGSSLSINPEASTANLLKIDLEKKIDRHTGEERDTWGNRAEFLLSLIGYAVGLGNVWRFPYLTQKNGGGAFLIPYAVMILIEGIPLFYLELAVGQRLRKGAVGAWNQIIAGLLQVSPYLGGIGMASAAVSFNVALYYNTIMAWCLLYLVQSFQEPLPWSTCPSVTNENVTVVDETCKRIGPTRYFWYQQTLEIAPSVDSTPHFNLKLAMALLVAWILVYLCMIKGIKSSGKVVYVTATFPYLVLVIFFFRGVTLHGFDKGLEYLFVPEWKRLLDPAVWLDAATQIFYSFGLAFGCLIALASYNPVRSNFVKEALFVSVVDFFTSIFTAVVVFSILGFKATQAYEECLETHNQTSTSFGINTEPDNATTCVFKEFLEGSASGTGLAFIVFTDAINQFPVSQLWSVLFFLMLLTLGLDSMFGTLEGALTSINDMMMFPGLRKELRDQSELKVSLNRSNKELMSDVMSFIGPSVVLLVIFVVKAVNIGGITCLLSFVVSLAFATSTGPYAFALFDSFSANIPLLVIAFMECVAISYKYGLSRLCDDIELMIGFKPNVFWLICWRYGGPFAMAIIFISSLIEIGNKGTVYEAWDTVQGTTVLISWPWWCQTIAALLILMSVLWIPGIALVKYFHLVEWKEEQPAFFPTEELIEERQIKPHKVTWFEQNILGFKS